MKRATTKPRFRLVAPEPLELEIHEAIAGALDKLLLPPAMWCHYPAGSVQLDPHEVARLARMGLKRGLPDIFIFFHGLWGIEIKRRGAKLSKTRLGRTKRGSPRILEGQEDVFPKLLASGAFAAIEIAHSLEEALALIRGWGIPLRPHSIG